MAEIITNDDAQYAYDIVKTICTEVGPGLPGTPQERERAAILKKELESHLGAGNVVVEEFTVAPAAFVGGLPICALFILIAALLNISVGRLTGVLPWLVAIAALALSIFPLLSFVLEFLLGYEFTDRFFSKKQSQNVAGALRRPGTQEVKRLLIVSGHHDSALEHTWLNLLGGVGFYVASATMLIGFVVMPVMIIIQLAGLITGNAGIVRTGTLGWVLLVYPIVPCIIAALFFSRGRKGGGVVPGAADNLSASALAVALCRFLVRNPSTIPADTEIRFISFGSEEAGVRGSRRYVERHLDELKRLDVRVLNSEMVAHPEIGILTSEASGTVRTSPEMVKSAVAAAERAGVPYKVKPASFGVGGDANPFCKAGLKATTLLCYRYPQQWEAWYHQRTDRPDVLTMEPLLNVLKLAFEWVRNGGE